MRNLKIKSLLCLSILSLLGCTEEIDQVSQNACGIVMTAKDFEYEDGSRTFVDITNDGAKFTWAENDTVGIFPDKGHQVDFPMINGAGTKNAYFSGGGWALKPSSTYAAYYPFQGNIYLDKTKVPVSFEGQVQTGNASTAHLGKYDYMAAVATTPSEGKVNFNFEHLCALVEFNITVPNKGDLTSVTLSSSSQIFVDNGYVDLTSTTPSIVPIAKSSSFSIHSKELHTFSNNEIVKIYAILSPADYSSKEINVQLINNGIIITGKVEMKEIKAGKAYQFFVSFESLNPLQTYNVEEPGTLPQLVGEENKYKIKEMSVSGRLNGTDVLFLRDMAGSSKDNHETMGMLENLSMENATIVAGGSIYYEGGMDMHEGYYPNITLSTNDNQITHYMFSNCKSLRSIVLPKTITDISGKPFAGCTNLVQIIVPEGVAQLGREAFSDCFTLKHLSLPTTISSVGDYAFADCREIPEIKLSQITNSIGNNAFESCLGLTSFVVPNSVSSIGASAFAHCANISQILLPDKLEKIGDAAFLNCKKMTSITLPGSLTDIGGSLFANCENLKTVYMKNGIKILNIGFLEDSFVETIFLPSSLTDIWKRALSTQTLKEIYCFASVPPTLYSNNIPATCLIYVPKGSVEKYKSTSGWKDHAANIFEMPDGITEP